MHNVAQALRAAGFVTGVAALMAIPANRTDAHETTPAGPQALPAGDFGGPFVLMDHMGRVVSDQTYLGRMQVVYFGYTHCPDICPIDVANIAQAVDLLGPRANEVQPLFITIDPARDTTQRLSEWLGAVHPRFTGLTGTAPAVAAAAAAFKVVYEKVETANGYGYAVSHPGLIYVMDRDGRFVFLLPPGTPPEIIANELRAALDAAR